jgi:hypothetical protein
MKLAVLFAATALALTEDVTIQGQEAILYSSADSMFTLGWTIEDTNVT